MTCVVDSMRKCYTPVALSQSKALRDGMKSVGKSLGVSSGVKELGDVTIPIQGVIDSGKVGAAFWVTSRRNIHTVLLSTPKCICQHPNVYAVIINVGQMTAVE